MNSKPKSDAKKKWTTPELNVLGEVTSLTQQISKTFSPADAFTQDITVNGNDIGDFSS